MATTNWLEGLKRFEVGEILDPDFVLFQMEKTATIPDVLAELSSRGLQCIPVYDSENQLYAGLIDTLDIVCVVVVMDSFKGLVDVVADAPVSWQAYCSQENLVFCRQSAGDICNASERNAWRPVQLTDSVETVLGLFGLPCGLHRAPVVDKDNFLHGFITQSSLAAWLADALKLLSSPVLDRPIGDFGSHAVLSVAHDRPAIDGFKTMFDGDVSGLAVVDAAGKLVGCLSASDIKRSAGYALFSDLHKPVADYLNIAADKFPTSTHPVTVTAQNTFGELFALIKQHRIHRVFVVDEAGKPTAVISLTDILDWLAKQSGN